MYKITETCSNTHRNAAVKWTLICIVKSLHFNKLINGKYTYMI